MTLAPQSHGVSMQIDELKLCFVRLRQFSRVTKGGPALFWSFMASCQASLFPLCLLYKVPKCEVLCATWHLGCVVDILPEFDPWHQAAVQKHWQRWLVMADQQIFGAGKICMKALPSTCCKKHGYYHHAASLVLNIGRALIFGCCFVKALAAQAWMGAFGFCIEGMKRSHTMSSLQRRVSRLDSVMTMPFHAFSFSHSGKGEASTRGIGTSLQQLSTRSLS